MTMTFVESWRLLEFSFDYANFEEREDAQLRKINKLRAKLGLSPKAIEKTTTEQPNEPLDYKLRFPQGTRVESPRYGEGVVLGSRMSGPYEKVTIRFSLYGIKTLVANFAHLKQI